MNRPIGLFCFGRGKILAILRVPNGNPASQRSCGSLKSNLSKPYSRKDVGPEKIVQEVVDEFDVEKEDFNSFRYSRKDGNIDVGIGITYSDKIEFGNFDETMGRLRSKVDQLAEKLSLLIGVKPSSISEAYGGYNFVDDSGVGSISGEPSFPTEFSNYKSVDDVLLFSALMGDLGFESQSAVFLWE